MSRLPPKTTPFPYTTLFRSKRVSPSINHPMNAVIACGGTGGHLFPGLAVAEVLRARGHKVLLFVSEKDVDALALKEHPRSEEHTSELQSQFHLVCRLLLEKK